MHPRFPICRLAFARTISGHPAPLAPHQFHFLAFLSETILTRVRQHDFRLRPEPPPLRQVRLLIQLPLGDNLDYSQIPTKRVRNFGCREKQLSDASRIVEHDVQRVIDFGKLGSQAARVLHTTVIKNTIGSRQANEIKGKFFGVDAFHCYKGAPRAGPKQDHLGEKVRVSRRHTLRTALCVAKAR